MISASEFLIVSGAVAWVWLIWQAIRVVHERWRRLKWALGFNKSAVRRVQHRW